MWCARLIVAIPIFAIALAGCSSLERRQDNVRIITYTNGTKVAVKSLTALYVAGKDRGWERGGPPKREFRAVYIIQGLPPPLGPGSWVKHDYPFDGVESLQFDWINHRFTARGYNGVTEEFFEKTRRIHRKGKFKDYSTRDGFEFHFDYANAIPKGMSMVPMSSPFRFKLPFELDEFRCVDLNGRQLQLKKTEISHILCYVRRKDLMEVTNPDQLHSGKDKAK
jgi:hypothetical protein